MGLPADGDEKNLATGFRTCNFACDKRISGIPERSLAAGQESTYVLIGVPLVSNYVGGLLEAVPVSLN